MFKKNSVVLWREGIYFGGLGDMSQSGGPRKLIFESGDPGKLLRVLRKIGGSIS